MFPAVNEAIGALAKHGQEQWIQAVKTAPGIWIDERKEYEQSIKWEYTGEFSARIWSNYKYADQIDNGRPARDLKLMLNTSMKVRRSSTGKRYLIIPFGHKTADMSPGTYSAAKSLTPTLSVGLGRRVSGTGAWDTKTKSPATVAQAQYKWGQRLKTDVKNENGMVRMDTQGKGKAKHSTYLTFRVMIEGSSGWIVPAKPGLLLLPAITADLQPKADIIIGEAVRKYL
jgi:hypothetical protein